MVINNEPIIFNDMPRTSQAVRKTVSRELNQSRYSAKIVQTPAEIESALRLRHEVFNLELSAATRKKTALNLDFDEYDANCKHLLVLNRLCGKTIGTYRLNSIETAKNLDGFYAFNDFGIEYLPSAIVNQSVEVGRFRYPIFTHDCDLGARIYQYFKRCGLIHADLNIKPRRRWAFSINEIYESKAEQVELPSLFNLYLKIGAKVCGEPRLTVNLKRLIFS